MVLSDSCKFLVESLWFFGVFFGSWRFLEVLGGLLLFLVDFGGSRWLLIIHSILSGFLGF